MSRPINITSAVTVNIASFSGVTGSVSTGTTYPPSNGVNSSGNTSNYATFSGTSTSSGYAYYNFDEISIPSNAVINSVSCVARGRVSNASRCYASFQLMTGNTAKGSAVNFNTTTVSACTLSTGTWTASELEDVKLRITVRRVNNNQGGSARFYGATLTVNYSVNGTEYEVSFDNQSSDVTTEPSSTQYVLEGGNQEITFNGISSLDDYTIEDNGTDISSSLIYVEPSGEKSSVLGTYNLISGGFSSDGEDYFSGLSGNGVDASQTTSNYYSSGSDSIAVFSYDFNFSDIPQTATITRVYCQVNGHAESTSNSDEYMCVRLILGTSANTISDELNFKSVGTSNSTQTIEATTLPSVSDISNLKLMCRLGYYGGAINGATCYVEYADETGLGSYTYTISNIQTDHTISINDAGGTFYTVNASSTYTGATVSPATQSIREGRTANVQIAVSNLYEIVVKDNGTDVTSGLVQNSTGYTYSVSNVQGTRNITVEEATYYTVTTSSTYTGATATATPSKVYAGQSSVVDITVDNLYEIILKDNNVDVTSSVVEVQGETNTVTFDPTQYVSSASSYSSIYNTYDPTSGVSSSGSTSRACVYSNTGSGAESKLTYKFDCSSIPQNATITNVVCAVKCSVYQTTYFATRTVQLYNGSTAKGTATTITATGSNGSVITTNGGSWTREELDDISIVERVVRGTSSTTSDASFSFWGATLSVSYTVPAGKTYTLTNVSANHTIAIEEAPYYTVSTSSSYNGATVSANPAKVYSSQSSVVTITVSNLYEINVTDNGNDIKGSLAGSNGTYTYTLSNLAANHTIAVSEATKYLVAASSKYAGTTISPASSYVYSGQSITLTISGFSAKNIVKDNGTDVTSSLIQSGSNYLYTISNVSQAHEVVVYYEDNFIKVNGTFKQVRKYYKKINGEWTEITSSDFNSEIQNTVLVYGGQQTGTTVIGEVIKSGSTVEIVINDNTLQSGTYKFVYEDEMKTPLENVDEIKEFTIS